MSRDVGVGQRRVLGQGASAAPALRDVARHRRLETAEAEVAMARQVGRVAVGVRETRPGQRHRAIVALGREAVDDRAARIAEAERASPPCRTPRPPRRRGCVPAARRPPRAGTRYRLVCPPDTTSTTAGSGISPPSRTSDSMWPARWCTGTNGTSRDHASDLANDSPTRSEPTRPGPCVTAIGSYGERPGGAAPASSTARSTTPQMSRMCWRAESSGTMPPHARWMSICDATTLERTAHGPQVVVVLLDDGGRRLVARGLDAEDAHCGSTRGDLRGAAHERGQRRRRTARGRCPAR